MHQETQIKVNIENMPLFEKVKKLLNKRNGSHDFSHILRVLKVCHILNKTQKSNWRLIEAMALLHDIVRLEDAREKESVKFSLIKAKNMLKKMKYSEKEIKLILDGISTHSLHSEERRTPKTLEAKILFDADKIDATGYIGIARWLYRCSNMNLTIDKAARSYLSELEKFKSKNKYLAYTSIGREIIKKRVKISKKIMENLINDFHSDAYLD